MASDFDSQDLPTISIITPSLNQGKFLEETIRSVLLQGYPNLEYIVMDGGSADQSIAILEKYSQWISKWESRKDKGQTDAINKGIEMTSGEIIGWLNSDDVYVPGAFQSVLSAFQNSRCDVVTGTTVYFDETGGQKATKNPGEISVDEMLLTSSCTAPQPSTFWSRTSWNKFGPLKLDLHYRMDYAFFLCLAASDLNWVVVPDELACFRLHGMQKTNDWSSKPLHAESVKAIQYFSEVEDFSDKFSNQIKRARYFEGWLHRWMAVNKVYLEGWRDKCRLFLAPFYNWRCLILPLYYKKLLGSFSFLIKQVINR